jgi:hypothetical protein
VLLHAILAAADHRQELQQSAWLENTRQQQQYSQEPVAELAINHRTQQLL